eukprot:scpid7911/ scgid4989/ 
MNARPAGVLLSQLPSALDRSGRTSTTPGTWCRVETCLDLTFGQNSSTVPYGRLKVTNLGQYDPLSPDLSWRVQQYQAQFRYSCDAGTKLLGTAVRTCNATGMWSGNRPFCFVQDHQCYANTKCADGKVCCEWGGIGAVGLNCCKPTTKLFIGERFSNLSRPCFKDLEDNYFPCMTQIIKCIDDDDDQDRCLTEWVLPDYLYGCSSNLGDKVPQYRGSSTSDQDLVEFCKRDQRTVACTELQTTYDSYTVNAVALRARTCLPRTCASDPAADLRALAESTLKLRCHVQKRTSYYCTIYSVTLNCSNGLQATARQEDGACAQCPPPGGDPKLTKCCTYNGKRIGCCLPKVRTILSEQAEPIDSPACRNSVLAAMTPCVRLITDCLNSLAGTKGDYICPSYHNCKSNRQTASQCPTYYAGSKHSLWCQTSCEFPGDPARSCQSDNFCLEQTCNTTTDLEQLAYSDARLICDYTKLANNVENCDRVKVTWFCSHGSDRSGGPGRTVTAEYKDPSNSTISILPTKPPQHSRTVGLAVGLSVGIVVFLLVIVAIGFFVIRPRLKANPWRNLEGPDSTLVYKDEDC